MRFNETRDDVKAAHLRVVRSQHISGHNSYGKDRRTSLSIREDELQILIASIAFRRI